MKPIEILLIAGLFAATLLLLLLKNQLKRYRIPSYEECQ